ncbi:MAG: hypothetical protein GF344_09075, partial [Chitinivibrionales bacterium]|nr:hypothetical protein [Chitinivibrionales bacterium]
NPMTSIVPSAGAPSCNGSRSAMRERRRGGKIRGCGAFAIAEGLLYAKAGKLFFKRLDTYLKDNRSVIIESTLSGFGLAKRLEAFKASGYTLHLVYVFLDSPDLCNKRIRARVEKGGHNVPPHDVDRRYLRSLRNFVHVYMPSANKWVILYNGIKRPIEVAVGENDAMMVLDEGFYGKFREIAK